MVDWSPAIPTAIPQIQAGSDYVTKLFDQQAKRSAGSKYAAGDYTGASGDLAARGDIEGAQGVQKYATQQMEQQQDYIARAVPVLQHIYDSAAQSQGPEAARAAVVQGFDHLSTEFPQLGFAPDKTAAFRQSLATDAPGTLNRLSTFTQKKFTYEQQGDALIAIDPATNRPAWIFRGGKAVSVPEGGKLVPTQDSFTDLTGQNGPSPFGNAQAQPSAPPPNGAGYSDRISALTQPGQAAATQAPQSPTALPGGPSDPAANPYLTPSPPPTPGISTAHLPKADGGTSYAAQIAQMANGQPGAAQAQPGDPPGTIYGVPKPPTTRTRIQGDREVVEEWRDGKWNQISEGPRYKPSAATSGPGGAFASKTITERMMNVLSSGNPSSPEYAAAYAYLAKPKLTFDPNTGEAITATPDMSWARPPGGRGGSAASPNPQSPFPGQAPPSPGQPTITGAPGRATSPARATFEANVNQAQSDIAVAERMFFPSGQFDRGMAMTGAAGIPLTKGREANQAIRRAVEIILRLRTGAAAPDNEVNNYANMFAPSALDNDEGAATKMTRLKQFFEDSKRIGGSKIPGAGATPPPSDALSQARDAIAKGADRKAVMQRLQQNGIDPGGL